MRYHVLVSDYDGTLASSDGHIAELHQAALERLRATGRKILLVTGRRLEDLRTLHSDLTLFDMVVAENGAVLYWPSTHEIRKLAAPPTPLFAETLKRRGVPDVTFGHVIVATWQPFETVVLEVIRELGLEMQVIFNKGAVMVLPSGVNKGTGLRAALDVMKLSQHNVVCIGDAENDHALLAVAECGVAVANALPSLKEKADIVTEGEHGSGVSEIADRLITNDLIDMTALLSQHDLPIGTGKNGEEIFLPAYGMNVLLAGTSGGGKSTFTTAFLERLHDRKYQYCVFDPEGDYDELAGAVVLGDRQEKPGTHQILKMLGNPAQNVVVNLLGLGMDDRPRFFDEVMSRLQLERSRAGHPHWVIMDEAHHLAPQSGMVPSFVNRDLMNLFMITVHPEHLSPALLYMVHAVVVIGANPAGTLQELAHVLDLPAPQVQTDPLESGDALLWWPGQGQDPIWLRSIPPQTERRRHNRKYAEGELPADRSFYFRGMAGKLNLRAQNLMSFLQLGDGVDDETWNYHLHSGGYSRWMRDNIKDHELADEVAEIERNCSSASAVTSRRAIRNVIEKRYTGSA
jgi:phosphoglycolate phosphatase (TIGR01487 family)